MLAPWKKNYDQPRHHIKKRRHYFANRGPFSQSYGFSSSHVWMWELGYKKSWAPKNCCFWTVVLEETHESPLDCKDVRKHLTGGFPCAVLDLSWILCSLLIPEYSWIKRRGKPLLGLRNARISFVSFSIWWKVTIYDPLLIWIAFWPYGLYCSLLPW